MHVFEWKRWCYSPRTTKSSGIICEIWKSPVGHHWLEFLIKYLELVNRSSQFSSYVLLTKSYLKQAAIKTLAILPLVYLENVVHIRLRITTVDQQIIPDV